MRLPAHTNSLGPNSYRPYLCQFSLTHSCDFIPTLFRSSSSTLFIISLQSLLSHSHHDIQSSMTHPAWPNSYRPATLGPRNRIGICFNSNFFNFAQKQAILFLMISAHRELSFALIKTLFGSVLIELGCHMFSPKDLSPDHESANYNSWNFFSSHPLEPLTITDKYKKKWIAIIVYMFNHKIHVLSFISYRSYANPSESAAGKL